MSTSTSNSNGAKVLQERLHELLTRLAATIELIKNWKEAAGDSSGHVETTSKLISSINSVIASIQKVDGTVKADAVLRKNLQECLIPLDLLDLLDHGGGINPDCFSRALLKEALGQLAGLKRRKLALEMLGAAVESGLKKREREERRKIKGNSGSSPENLKRKRSEDSTSPSKTEDKAKEPPTKKASIAKG